MAHRPPAGRARAEHRQEDGPRDLFANPAASDPKLPLVLKLNGTTEIPSDAEALSRSCGRSGPTPTGWACR